MNKTIFLLLLLLPSIVLSYVKRDPSPPKGIDDPSTPRKWRFTQISKGNQYPVDFGHHVILAERLDNNGEPFRENKKALLIDLVTYDAEHNIINTISGTKPADFPINAKLDIDVRIVDYRATTSTVKDTFDSNVKLTPKQLFDKHIATFAKENWPEGKAYWRFSNSNNCQGFATNLMSHFRTNLS